ncbi:MAG: hypothetical protein ACK56I_35425, partial [bacterium]
FLYTAKLNENATKNLRKTITNKEERQALAQIFGLGKTSNDAAGQQQEKMEQIKLDFYSINYEFCKEHYFSNEKISTLLAIMDYLLHHMLERHLLPEEGLKLLKRILERHSL